MKIVACIPMCQPVIWILLHLLQITPAKDGKPVIIELIDAKTKELKDTLEVSCRFFTKKI